MRKLLHRLANVAHLTAVEYLGTDYPLYFESLAEAAEKALDLQMIADANHYLKQYPTRTKLDGQYFLDSIVNSEVYQLLFGMGW